MKTCQDAVINEPLIEDSKLVPEEAHLLGLEVDSKDEVDLKIAPKETISMDSEVHSKDGVDLKIAPKETISMDSEVHSRDIDLKIAPKETNLMVLEVDSKEIDSNVVLEESCNPQTGEPWIVDQEGNKDPRDCHPEGNPYRTVKTCSSSEEESDSTSSDSDDSLSSSLSSSSECSTGKGKKTQAASNTNRKTKIEEILDYDLPAIEELNISIAKDEIELLGAVISILGSLVVVQSLRGMPALNFDTVLFLEDGKSLGAVFDVFGPVIHPLYSIRVSSEEIAEKKISVKTQVYYAPKKGDVTKFVFATELLKFKGSDASWEDNKEPPEKYVEYSDDEAEKIVKVKSKHRRRSFHERGETGLGGQPQQKRNYNNRYSQHNKDGGSPASSRQQSSVMRPPRFRPNTFQSAPAANGPNHTYQFAHPSPQLTPAFVPRVQPTYQFANHSPQLPPAFVPRVPPTSSRLWTPTNVPPVPSPTSYEFWSPTSMPPPPPFVRGMPPPLPWNMYSPQPPHSFEEFGNPRMPPPCPTLTNGSSAKVSLNFLFTPPPPPPPK